MVQSKVQKEGWLRKKGSRSFRWTMRYFTLSDSTFTYKIKPGQSDGGSYDLVPGCICTEIVEDSRGVRKKQYVFWVIWPYDKNASKVKLEKEDDSDGEEDLKEREEPPPNGKAKNLKQIVQSEVLTQRREQRLAEEQLERHQTHDNNVNTGIKVAAVAVGGVVIGALTAGIGLIPYLTVVGVTAAAGGAGVMYSYKFQHKRPADSRLILACESLAEAESWKAAIETQVELLEKMSKPTLPPSADPKVISEILSAGAFSSCTNVQSRGPGTWRTFQVCEGIRLLRLEGRDDLRCKRAQVTVNSTPLQAFLALMDVSTNPRSGTVLKMLHVLDDHADILGLTVTPLTLDDYFVWPTSPRAVSVGRPVSWKTALSRFWRLDDDGNYLIALSSTKHPDFPIEASSSVEELSRLMIVFTVSPRKDHSEFDDDLQEALVTCAIQLQGSYRDDVGALDAFMDSCLHQLADLRYSLSMANFSSDRGAESKGSTDTDAKAPASRPSALKSDATASASLSMSRSKSHRKSHTRGQSERDRRVNAEAAALRMQISAKDIAIQRLEKTLKKKDLARGTGGASKDILVSIEQHLRELKELQAAYKRITGQQYTSSGGGLRSAFFGRARTEQLLSPAKGADSLGDLQSTAVASVAEGSELALDEPRALPTSFWRESLSWEKRLKCVVFGWLSLAAESAPDKRTLSRIIFGLTFLLTFFFSLGLTNMLSGKRGVS